jgi:hypothetical protein
MLEFADSLADKRVKQGVGPKRRAKREPYIGIEPAQLIPSGAQVPEQMNSG